MIYAAIGFLFGIFVPIFTRFYMVFQRSGLAFCLRKRNKKTSKTLSVLRKKFLWSCWLYGTISAVLSFFVVRQFGEVNFVWNLGFLWTLILLSAIDLKMHWLPDVLTIPLLLFGYLYATFGYGFVGVGESALGALMGYFMPFVASLFFIYKKEPVIGGGDIKLLAAVGAWLGLLIPYVVTVSAVVFMLFSLVWKKRAGPLGPAIAISAIAVAFWFL